MGMCNRPRCSDAGSRFTRRTGIAAVALLGTAWHVAAAQLVAGQVREADTRTPIADAAVYVADSSREIVGFTRTDAAGEFRLRVPADWRTLRVLRIGFAPESVSSGGVAAFDTTEIVLNLRVVVPTLSRVVVEAERQRIIDTRAMGLDLKAIGTHPITPSEIALWSRGARNYLDAIRQGLPPGVRISESNGVRGRPNAPCVEKTRRMAGTPMECVMVYVDGVRIDDPRSVIDLVPPELLDHAIFLQVADGSGMRFGTDAEGGVLMLFTKYGGYALSDRSGRRP